MFYLDINLVSNVKDLQQENHETLWKHKGRPGKMEGWDVFLMGKTEYQTFSCLPELFHKCNALYIHLNGIYL